jgi:hypothetical protein
MKKIDFSFFSSKLRNLFTWFFYLIMKLISIFFQILFIKIKDNSFLSFKVCPFRRFFN